MNESANNHIGNTQTHAYCRIIEYIKRPEVEFEHNSIQDRVAMATGSFA